MDIIVYVLETYTNKEKCLKWKKSYRDLMTGQYIHEWKCPIVVLE